MRPNVVLAVVALATVRCASEARHIERPSEVAPVAPPKNAAAATSVPSIAAGGVIHAKSVGNWCGKPPLKSHAFDVVLANPSRAARWIVVPEQFSETAPFPGDDESEIGWFVLAAQPRLIMARATGANFQAIRLTPGAHVTIHRLWIESWWNDIPPEAKIPVLVVADIRVGKLDLAALAASDPTTDSASGAGARDDAAPTETIWSQPGHDTVPVSFDVEARTEIVVPMVRACN